MKGRLAFWTDWLLLIAITSGILVWAVVALIITSHYP